MENKNLAADEARRAAQLESMKARVEGDVNASIARRAVVPSAPEADRVDRVAHELRGNAIAGVVEKDREATRARGLARTAQFINYAFGILYALLAVRLVLGLIGARSSAGFVRLIDTMTNPFYGMFRGIVESPSLDGRGHTLTVPLLVALGAYGLLHLGILGLLRLFAHRKTEI